jgi:hypothetical protein
MSDARAVLAPYDLVGARTTRRLTDISERVRGQPETGLDAVLWLTAADLLVIAAYRDDDALRQRLAEALGTSPHSVVSVVLDGLNEVPVRGTVDPAGEAELAIRLIRTLAREGPQAVRWAGQEGPRADALFIREVRRAAEGQDVVAAMAALSADPCGSRTTCREPFATFDQTGRRAVATLSRAAATFARLSSPAHSTDPFVAAIAADLDADRATLAGARLRPGLTLAEDLGLPTVDAGGRASTPSVVVMVQRDRVLHGWTPMVALGDAGEIRRVAPGSPMLPSTTEIRFGGALRALPRPIRTLVEQVRQLGWSEPGVRVAVGAVDGVPSEVLARVLWSLLEGGVARPELLAVGPEGEARTVPLNVVRSRRDARDRHVVLRMRLGGFSLQTPTAGWEEIPRVRPDDGGSLSFDYDTLRSRVAAAEATPLVSFMSGLGSTPLVQAVFVVAPPGNPLDFAVF